MTEHEVDKLTLTSYFTGDLDGEKHALVEKHLVSCASCRDYLNELEAEKSSFLNNVPFESLPASPQKKSTTIIPFRKYYAIAATVVLFITGGLFYQLRETQDYIRIKGNTGIKIFSQNKNGTIEKRENSIYYPGECIQITYSCTDKHYLILFSIDEKGVISKYYPDNEDSSIILEKGADIPLPNSIALDSYIGRELYIALFSGHRVYLPDILDQVKSEYEKNGLSEKITLQEENGFDVHKVLITKAEPKQ